MLTGYNTDIAYAGVTYHVQTEDRGTENPVIETLVYAKGEILYSQRTPYADLLEQGADEKTLAAFMDRQHRTVVEAIRRGQIEHLGRQRRAAAPTDETAVSSGGGRPPAEPSAASKTLDQVIMEYLEAQKQRAHLVLRSQGTDDLVYGQSASIRIVALNSHNQEPVAGVEIAVVFKSTAEPRRLVLAEGVTDAQGLFETEAPIPPFSGGTSAVVITGQCPLGQSEIKQLVHR